MISSLLSFSSLLLPLLYLTSLPLPPLSSFPEFGPQYSPGFFLSHLLFFLDFSCAPSTQQMPNLHPQSFSPLVIFSNSKALISICTLWIPKLISPTLTSLLTFLLTSRTACIQLPIWLLHLAYILYYASQIEHTELKNKTNRNLAFAQIYVFVFLLLFPIPKNGITFESVAQTKILNSTIALILYMQWIYKSCQLYLESNCASSPPLLPPIPTKYHCSPRQIWYSFQTVFSSFGYCHRDLLTTLIW